MSTVVEFCGVPGAGKTYLASATRDLLERTGVAVAPRQRRRSLAARATGCWRYRRHLLQAASACATAPRSHRERLRALRYVVATVERMHGALSDPSDRIYLVEEGPVQRLFMLLVDRAGVRNERVQGLVDSAPRSQLVVHVAATTDEVLQRLSARSRGLPPRIASAPDPAGVLREATRMLARAASSAGPLSISARSDDPGAVIAALGMTSDRRDR